MAHYVLLVKWTAQGIKNVKDSIKRFEAARAGYEKVGVKVRDILWTLGEYDMVMMIDAPSDEVAAVLGLQAGSLGNVTTVTMRAFDESEMTQLIKKI